ncbi:MAG TPA: hypothetical protein VEJ36_08210 [Nitrososphaerales archaeon]|nr:hypothetical protein [Nitrososphaerales archaeon]
MRAGLSAVYGFVVIYLLIMAGLSALSNVAGSQDTLQQSLQRAEQIESSKSSEALLVDYVNQSLSVMNPGGLVSNIDYILLLNGTDVTASPVSYQLEPGGNLSTRVPGGETEVGIVTSSGNAFWSRPSPGIEASLTEELLPGKVGLSSGGPPSSTTLLVTGDAQTVSLSTGQLPIGVTATISPNTLESTPSGVKANLTFAFSGSDYGLFELPVIASGSDGQNSTAILELQTTAPDGSYVVQGDYLYPNGLGYPMEGKLAYWKGTYFGSFEGDIDGTYYDAYVPLYYGAGWNSGEAQSMGVAPYGGYNYGLAQASNTILKVASSEDGANLCFNIGTIGGESVNWIYNGVGCEGPQTPTFYPVVGYASGLVDSGGNWWASVETKDGDGDYHLEVLEATNGAWGESYVSPSFGSVYQPVPGLFALENGDVAMVYTYFSPTGACFPDYIVMTSDSGYTWSDPIGPFYAGGAPLCYDNSSGASVGDTVYFGGVNNSGKMSYWSYDPVSGATSSGTLASGVDYGALGSSEGELVAVYGQGGCGVGSGSEVHLTWSYDGGSSWSDPVDLGCADDHLLLSDSLSCLQIIVETAVPSSSGLLPEFFFYTI